MNRIILIGNGFDLAHNLRTSYRNFIDDYWDKKNELLQKRYKESEIKSYEDYEDKDIIVRNITWWQTSSFNNNEKKYGYNMFVDRLRQGHVRGNLHFKNHFLKRITENAVINSWVDIENEYYEELKNVLNRLNPYGKDAKLLNRHFNQIKIELEKYLTETLKLKLTNGTEKIIGLEHLIYSKFSFADFTQKGKDNLIDIAYQKILSLKEKDEKQELSMLDTSEETMTLYDNIKTLVSKNTPIIHESLVYSFDTREDFVKLLDKRKDMIDISSLLLPENVLFLNFNYTNTEDKYSINNPINNYFANKTENYKQEFKINQETIHIHSELNNRKNPIIFGYGDELDDDYKQILKKNDNNLLENVKSIKYGETYNYKRLLNFIESDNYQVFIMGHSCGNSDRTLLNTLFEHTNCQSIKIFYHKKVNGQEESDDFSNIYRNVTRNFKNFANLRAKVVDKSNSISFPQLEKNN
ncbi:MAG: bacteriophage abortive infection AbiH family protein [Dysgonamonadaceae bacterium]|jgi:hypothetical protein|nr:bacteriophage abortive infection AbiH family protein [Dysgonamonadaceae bacterium]